MMSEITNPEDSFEIVQPNIGIAIVRPAEHPSVPLASTGEATIGAPPAPSALPTFAQMPHIAPTAPALPAVTNFATQPPEPSPQQQQRAAEPTATSPPTSSYAGGVGGAPNPFSVRASAGQSLSSVVHASPHVPHAMGGPQLPSVGPTSYLPPAPTEPGRAPPPSYSMPEAHTGLDMSFEISSVDQQGQPCDPRGPLSAMTSYGKASPGNAGVWNWVNKTISQSDFLSKVAEKAKTSMDNMITTLDPQMKDYMSPAGALELYIISADADMVSAIRNGFSRHVPNLIARGVPPAYAPNVAQQPVGFDNGVRAAKEYIQAVRSSGLVSPNSLVLGCSSFIVELLEQNWYEMICVALNNGANVDLYTFSQPTAVPSFVMDVVKLQTPVDYALSATGLAYSVDQVMAHSHGLTNSTWQLQYAGVAKHELATQACVSLAYLYKSNFS